MKSVDMNLKENGYKIIIGDKIFSGLGSKVKGLKIGKDAVIVTNPVVNKLYGRVVTASLKKKGFSVKVFEVPDGEKSKSAKSAFTLMEAIARYDCFKQIFIVALGGGVIGDLAGYVASAYKRGIPYIQVPTTLLAQTDSAIGGKVAVDLPVGKNLVGAFYQPKMVFSDTSVLSTLDIRQLRNGLAEAVKYGVIYDRALFDYMAKYYSRILACDTKVLNHIVINCSQIKAQVVVADEKETKGVRVILNFGHTLGHAIEAAGKYKVYQHGEAIALGMRMAVDISCHLKMLTLKDAVRINTLLSDIGLPQKIKKSRMLGISEILRHMKHDKKFTSGKNRFVLATSIGTVQVVENVSSALIKTCFKKYQI